MSLINEALKKAQRQRGADQPFTPGAGGEPVAHTRQREGTAGVSSFAIKLGAGLLLTLGVVLGGFYAYKILLGTPAPVVAPATEKPNIAPAPVNAPVAMLPPAPEKVNAGMIVAPVLAPVTAPTPSAGLEPVPTAPRPVPVAVAVEIPPVSAKPASPAKMSPKATAYIESLRISGIRASTADSKVLMNDRVYRAGDLVEHELGLRLVEIKSNSLTFEDEAGLRYTRSF